MGPSHCRNTGAKAPAIFPLSNAALKAPLFHGHSGLLVAFGISRAARGARATFACALGGLKLRDCGFFTARLKPCPSLTDWSEAGHVSALLTRR